MLRARRYLDRVTLYTKEQSRDEFRSLTTSFVSKGEFPCELTQVTGFRLMQYQQIGINYPIIIDMREVGFTPEKIEWQGQEVSIKSIVPNFRQRTIRIEGFMKEQPIYPTTTVQPTTTNEG